MHVITLNGKPVTVKTMAVVFGWGKQWPLDYMICTNAASAKQTYHRWSGMRWNKRHLGIECRRLKPEDAI